MSDRTGANSVSVEGRGLPRLVLVVGWGQLGYP